MERRTERTGAAGAKPVPMKLFAAWEVDRTPSNCIPRLCTLRVTRLRVLGSLGCGGGGEAGGAVTLAARMHSSKRTLRSNDIAVPPPGHDVELDLSFSLQYPHFVKRDGNRLQIMLQRRKKYKNRTILGYKTLAEGVIRMDQVLQRSMDMELELVSVGGKGGGGGGGGVPGAGGGTPLAKLSITGLASTPVDHDTKNNNMLISERGYSDEEEEGELSSVEEADDVMYGAPPAAQARRRQHRNLPYNKTDLSYTKMARNHNLSYLERDSYMRSKTTDRDSDSELENSSAKRKSSHGKFAQRNLKQKFAALLRRFRVPEELAERGAARDPRHPHTDIDELFQELESLSCGEGEDSGPDQMDTISIGSTPKPSLRPFFTSSRNLTEYRCRPSGEGEVCEERGSEGNSDGDQAADAAPSGASLSSSPPREKEERKTRMLLSANSGGSLIASSQAKKKNSISLATDLKAVQHDTAHSPTALQPRRSMLEQTSRLLGDESCPLAETLAVACARASGAATSLALPTLTVGGLQDAKLLLHALYARLNNMGNAGTGQRGVRMLLCGGDALVSAMLRAYTEVAARRAHDAPAPRFYIVPFGACCLARQLAAADPWYASLFGGETWSALTAAEPATHHLAEISSRIARYLSGATGVNNLSIGEAMVACRDKSTDEESSQMFVPFLSEVRVGCADGSSLELEEGGSPPARPSPPATPAPPPAPALPPGDLTPAHSQLSTPSAQSVRQPDPLELQVDYWLAGEPGSADSVKVSVKAGFRALLVTRTTHLQLSTVTKEKKQKIMRLGKKKEKASESEGGRAQTVDGVCRLICSAKSSSHPLKVYIDGVEWTGVKFFQLSTQWQTHVKHFPVASSGAPLAPQES